MGIDHNNNNNNNNHTTATTSTTSDNNTVKLVHSINMIIFEFLPCDIVLFVLYCFPERKRQNTQICIARKKGGLGGVATSERHFLHLVLDVPWHALFTFGIGGKEDFQLIQLNLYPSRDPVPFLSSAYWAAPTEKKHLTALTENEANFVLFIKAPFWQRLNQ